MIHAGFFEADISPSIGMINAAERIYPPKNDIRTPFSVCASFWQTGSYKVAVVGIDAIMLAQERIEPAAAVLKGRLGLDHLLVGASHTHKSGPCVDWIMPPEEVAEVADLDPEVRAVVAEDLGRPDPQYLLLLQRRIVDAVVCAAARAEEVRLMLGKSTVEDVGYNRRQIMKDGYTVSHAGKGNPDIVDFAGPVDKEAVVLGAVNSRDEIVGVIVNYGCHGTVGSEGFSADWPYFMRETIKRNINPRMVAVFLNGCCGDVTQVNNLSTEPHRSGDRWAKILGQRVGFAAVDVLAREDPLPFDQLRIATEEMLLDRRDISPERYAKALAATHEAYRRGNRTTIRDIFNRDTVLLWHRMKKNRQVRCQINSLQIGNLLLLANPTECFARIGIAIKAESPFEHTMVSELTNGYLGYLPTPDVFGPHGGGYESMLSGGNILEKNAWEKIQNASINLANRFVPEKVLETKRITNEKPWMAQRPEEA